MESDYPRKRFSTKKITLDFNTHPHRQEVLMLTQTNLRILVFGIVVALSFVCFSAHPVVARGTFYTGTWVNLYPSSLTDDKVINATSKVCQLCHESSSGGDGWNGYGWQIRLGLQSEKTIENAILDAGPFDSDSDPGGNSNSTEIGADTQPGWTTASNTIYFKNGSTAPGTPPAGLNDLDPTDVAVPEAGLTPATYALDPTRPNPFHTATVIGFDLPVFEHVRLRVFDVQGRAIKTLVYENLGPGKYYITWHGDTESGEGAVPGVYFYRLETTRYVQSRKTILMP